VEQFIVCAVCATAVLLALIAAWLVDRVARRAIAKAEPEDVPKVLAGLRQLVTGFLGFLPHPWRQAAGELAPTDNTPDPEKVPTPYPVVADNQSGA